MVRRSHKGGWAGGAPQLSSRVAKRRAKDLFIREFSRAIASWAARSAAAPWLAAAPRSHETSAAKNERRGHSERGGQHDGLHRSPRG